MRLTSERSVSRAAFIINGEYRSYALKVTYDIARFFAQTGYRFSSCKMCSALKRVFDVRFYSVTFSVSWKHRIDAACSHHRFGVLGKRRRHQRSMDTLTGKRNLPIS